MGEAKRRRRATRGSVRSQVQRILHNARQAEQVVPELRTEGVPFRAPRVVPPLDPSRWPGQTPRPRKRRR